jgi:hypothetical protein
MRKLVVGLVIGALLGLAVGYWAQLEMLWAVGGGALLGLILAFAFMGVPRFEQEEENPRDDIAPD